MAFSFFKKDAKDAGPAVKAGSRSRVRQAVARPLPGPVNRNPSSTIARGARVRDHSTLADKDCIGPLRLNAAKIDAIESEMARDFLRPGGAPTMFPNSAANSTLQRPSQQARRSEAAPRTRKTRRSLEHRHSLRWAATSMRFEGPAEGGGSAIEDDRNLVC